MTREFPLISSPHNPRFKQALKLRQRRARDRQGRMLVDGQREISLAIVGGVPIEEIFVDRARLDDTALSDWLHDCHDRGCQVWVLPTGLMARLGYGDRHDQCVATAPIPRRTLADLMLPDAPLVAIIEGVEKPGNLGAVVRTADAAGIDAVVLADGRTDLFNPNAIRASRGTLFTVPLCAATSVQLVDWLDRRQLQVCVARVDAVSRYDECDFRQGTAIVLGSEVEGVSTIWRAPRYTAIKLPMAGQADSLNVAVTAAVLFYEANRQRRAG